MPRNHIPILLVLSLTSAFGRCAPKKAGIPEIAANAATDVSRTTATDINGATITLMPSSDVRVQVTATFDVVATTYAVGSVFVGELVVNGIAQPSGASAGAIFDPGGTKLRVTVPQVWTLMLSGGASYTLKLTGRVNLASSIYNVAATHTRFSIVPAGGF